MNKILNGVLIIAILGAIGALFYTVAKPNSERFTEFYILGINGNATDYPTDFTLRNGQVISVQYGNGTVPINQSYGQVQLSIVNHEQQQTTYSVTMQIDSVQVDIPYNDLNFKILGPINLAPGEKWQQEIGIEPQHIGENEKVELFLYKDETNTPYLSLNLLVDVE